MRKCQRCIGHGRLIKYEQVKITRNKKLKGYQLKTEAYIPTRRCPQCDGTGYETT